MEITVNSEKISLEKNSTTLYQALVASGITQQSGIAVAVNEEIVPRSSWPNWQLQPNDKLLIITATQGG